MFELPAAVSLTTTSPEEVIPVDWAVAKSKLLVKKLMELTSKDVSVSISALVLYPSGSIVAESTNVEPAKSLELVSTLIVSEAEEPVCFLVQVGHTVEV